MVFNTKKGDIIGLSKKNVRSWPHKSYKVPTAVQINLSLLREADTKAYILKGLPEWMLFAFCNPDAMYFTADARCGYSKVKT